MKMVVKSGNDLKLELTSSNQEDLLRIKGLGRVSADLLKEAGINSISQLVLLLPLQHKLFESIDSVDQLIDGNNYLIKGKIVKLSNFTTSKKRLISEFRIEVPDGAITAIAYNQQWIRGSYKVGDNIVLYGQYRFNSRKLAITVSGFLKTVPENLPFILSTYSTRYGITSYKLKQLIIEALGILEPDIEYLPDWWRNKYNFIELRELLNIIHKSELDIKEIEKAKQELTLRQILIWLIESNHNKSLETKNNKLLDINKLNNEFKKLANKIKFKLSSSQEEALNDLVKDFSETGNMHRFIKGDVGSGKSIVAFLGAMLYMSQTKTIAIYVSPTRVLSQQQYLEFIKTNFLKKENVLLINDSSDLKLLNSTIKFIFVTHQLFYNDININNIGFIIFDEQHRFGVKQRNKILSLAPKNNCYVLSLSATPIPRSLARIRFSGLASSQLLIEHQKRNVKTHLINYYSVDQIVKLVDKLRKEGKLLIILPFIDSEVMSEEYTVKFWEDKMNNKDIKLSVLHGKLKNNEFSTIIKDFIESDDMVLLSTNILEVGFNDGNLNNLIIIGADRFGLASLHQMRGRVGRTGQVSNVYLINFTGEEKERLNYLVEEDDGNRLAELDLGLRGFGELFGVQQTGKYLVDIDKLSDEGFNKLEFAVNDLMNNIGIDDKNSLLSKIINKEDYKA